MHRCRFTPTRNPACLICKYNFCLAVPTDKSKGLEITAQSCNVEAFSEAESNSLTNIGSNYEDAKLELFFTFLSRQITPELVL